MDLGDTDKYTKVGVLEALRLIILNYMYHHKLKKLSQDVQLNSAFAFVDSISS